MCLGCWRVVSQSPVVRLQWSPPTLRPVSSPSPQPFSRCFFSSLLVNIISSHQLSYSSKVNWSFSFSLWKSAERSMPTAEEGEKREKTRLRGPAFEAVNRANRDTGFVFTPDAKWEGSFFLARGLIREKRIYEKNHRFCCKRPQESIQFPGPNSFNFSGKLKGFAFIGSQRDFIEGWILNKRAVPFYLISINEF